MPLQLDLKEQDLLSLEDAIAYEFFMENISYAMENAQEEGIDITEAIKKIAKASYVLANIFCSVRQQQIEKNQ